MSEVMDTALASARRFVDDAQAHALLGCDWGRKIALPGNTTPCTRAAEERIVLHNGGRQVVVQMCDEHGALIKAETEPHAPCGKPGCPGCGAGGSDR